MSFRSAVLGQPEIASIVFGYQAGLYEDVRPAFVACEELVDFDASTKLYMCDASLYEAFTPRGGAWAGPKQFRWTEYLLRTDVRDDRLPLHVAIAGGCAHLATRMLQCRPDLASEYAILLAFIKGQLETVEVLLDLRTTLPALVKSVNHAHREQNGYKWRFPVEFLVDLLAKNDANSLRLLARFGAGPNDFEGRRERDAHSNAQLSERVMRSAMQRATLANVTLALDVIPWLHYPSLVDDVAGRGFLPLVRSLHERGVTCSTDAMDQAAGNGHLEVVRFLHEHRSEGCTTRAMDFAATNGHLEVLTFLHLNRTEGCTTAALDGAISNGHLGIVRFLLEHRSEGASPNILDRAAANGHLDVVQYLHHQGSFGCTVDAVDTAASGGYLEVVTFLLTNRSEGCSRDKVVRKAFEQGHLRTAEYFLSLQYPSPTEDMKFHAFVWSQPEMLDVLRLYFVHGGTLDWSYMLSACCANNLPLVQFLHAHLNGGRYGPFTIGKMIQRKAWDVLHFLLAHVTMDDLKQALLFALVTGHLGLVTQLLERQPELHDDELLHVALGRGNMEAMRYLLAAGIGNPRECLREIVAWIEDVELKAQLYHL
ncbi:hypothetical protein SDRG_08567 [Saprolegnia diclina VS20]|uniref:Uncharacterized protein n=1 Tax=Saprolegnia diclina (strain VS20) TaxID=1156394 RepID=T0QGL8_SAPDV|nr:hypothetical protein SDRG_08567 [Saprolegnia diclina VS20]EQC33886.1 hypothetical protein SDRG_08567 [Saprolegnia diclina VS20]|eukprot:XP_008612681.1 hypothetical protein SDRG_08567 [Saprolegnia diclina VS20]